MSLDYEKIKNLISLVEKNKLEEFVLDEEEFSITIKAEGRSVPTSVHVGEQPVHQVIVAPDDSEDEMEEQADDPVEANENLIDITAPMVGVFYRCPSHDSPSFVEVGDDVEVGQTIGLIEAMKVFSEVPSEVAGKVSALPADNAQLVHQGNTLAVIDTSSA